MECDFTTVYAQVTEIKKIDGTKSKITKLEVKKIG
jgi:SH3 type 3 domain protein